MTNIFCINLKRDIGKKKCMTDIIKKLNGEFFKGHDIRIIDNNKITLKDSLSYECTRAAKSAKLELLNNFFSNSNKDYLCIFEDDIIIHNNFYEYFNKVIDFANNNIFKLIYLGVSTSINNINNPKNELNIINFNKFDKKRYAGAYGVIIHKSTLQYINYRANDTALYYKPFDIFCLGYIQDTYPENCFICNPQIVLPNITTSNIRGNRDQTIIWKNTNAILENYIFQKQIPFFVLIDNNNTKIKRFMKYVGQFIPHVKIIFITTKYLLNYLNYHINLNFDFIIINNCYNNINKRINIYLLKNKHLFFNYYIITNIYINWIDINYDFFDIINDKIKNHSLLSFKINKCPRCPVNIIQRCYNEKILNGFSIIKIDCEYSDELHIDNDYFYTVNQCYEISNNTFHNITEDDLIQDLKNNKKFKYNLQSWILHKLYVILQNITKNNIKKIKSNKYLLKNEHKHYILNSNLKYTNKKNIILLKINNKTTKYILSDNVSFNNYFSFNYIISIIIN
jgi:hypothetical protein